MRRWNVVLTVALVATGGVIGCSGDDPEVLDPDPTTAPTPARTEPTRLDPGDGPLVYVALGNSLLFSPQPGGVMRLYHSMLEEEFGVDVEFRDRTHGGQRTDNFLDRLRNEDGLRRDLAEADVVLMVIPNDEWSVTAPIALGVEGHDTAECGGDDGLQCFRETIADYEAMVDEIFVELTALVDTSETLVRITDFYVFTPGDDDQDGRTIERLGPLWHEAQEHVAAAAARYGLPVAHVYDDFMGPSGIERPEAKGLVAGDGIHPTEAGAERVAELVHELGYELVD